MLVFGFMCFWYSWLVCCVRYADLLLLVLFGWLFAGGLGLCVMFGGGWVLVCCLVMCFV